MISRSMIAVALALKASNSCCWNWRYAGHGLCGLEPGTTELT